MACRLADTIGRKSGVTLVLKPHGKFSCRPQPIPEIGEIIRAVVVDVAVGTGGKPDQVVIGLNPQRR